MNVNRSVKKSKLKGILFILTAAFGFSLMTTFVKLAGNDLPSYQKAFFRNFVALIFVAAIMLKKHESFIPGKGNLKYLIGRAAFGTAGLLCNFYAIDRLVLADANMLNKLSPFFAIIFSVILLKEKPNLVQITGVIVAFAGAVLIIKPGFANTDIIPSLAGVLGGMGAGIAYTYVRKLGLRGENSSLIIFFFSAFSCLVCIPFMMVSFTPMSAKQWIYLILAGLFACVGQFGITKAYVYAPAKEISVYDYTQILFAAILGFFIFDQVPDLLSIAGYFLICGAGIWMFIYNNRKAHSADKLDLCEK